MNKERLEAKAERLTEALRLLGLVRAAINEEVDEASVDLMGETTFIERTRLFCQNNRSRRELIQIKEALILLNLVKGIDDESKTSDLQS